MTTVADTALPGVKLITPRRHGDERGYFSETYSKADLARAGIDVDFVQDNQSRSEHAGTVRGLHFQAPPHGQDKIVRVLRGSVLDVVVDLRRSSNHFGRHLAIELSAANGLQLFVPIGFAHGFCTLEAGTEVLYKVSSPYAPSHDRGLAWDDPVLAIAWPAAARTAILSDRDRDHPRLADLPAIFN